MIVVNASADLELFLGSFGQLTQSVGVLSQPAADLRLGKTASRMFRNGGQTRVQFRDAHYGSVAHLVKKPEHTVALDRFLSREATKRSVTAQKYPGPGFCERESETISEGKSRFSPPVGNGAFDPVTV